MLILILKDHEVNGQTFIEGNSYVVDSTLGESLISSNIATNIIATDAKRVRTITVADTVEIEDRLLLVDGTTAAFNLTLLDPSLTTGIEFAVIKTDVSENAITLAGENVDGASTSVNAQYDAVTFISDGTSYYSKNKRITT